MLSFQFLNIELIDNTPDNVIAKIKTAIEIIICKNKLVLSPLKGNSCLRIMVFVVLDMAKPQTRNIVWIKNLQIAVL